MEKIEVVIATGNLNKVREYKEILEPLGIHITSMKEEGIEVDVEENGTTFVENSMIKAKAVASKTSKIVIADDSGLCLHALDGFPGIRSARFMEGSSYLEKNLALNEMLKDKEDKSAHYVCAISVVNGKRENCFVGKVYGTIVMPRSKGNGFGYDPIFLPNGFNETFGEMDEALKNKISHRAEASEYLVDYFKKIAR